MSKYELKKDKDKKLQVIIEQLKKEETKKHWTKLDYEKIMNLRALKRMYESI